MIKVLLIFGFSFFNPAPSDSIGMETVNGKKFVLHKVEAKETLFSISRRYRTTVAEIVQNNQGADSGLEVGRVLRIPYTSSPAQPATTTHTVATGETLYSISRKYNIPVDDLKSWNNLKENSLSVGQVLVLKAKSLRDQQVTNLPVLKKEGVHVVGASQTLYSIARQYEVSVDDLKAWNNLSSNELTVGQTLYVTRPANNQNKIVKTDPVVETKTQKDPVVEERKAVETPVASKEQTIRITESVRNGNEVVESGLAELIEGTDGNRKYLALHKTAPVGTILKIRNEMNSREVFVRVLGKLPDNAADDKLIIRISKSAYDRLGAIDPRFRVAVTYYK